MLGGLLSSEGLTGTGGLASKVAPSHGCWQEASVPSLRADHSAELPECPDDVAGSGGRGRRRGGERSRSAFYDLVSEVTHNRFCLVFFGSESPSPAHTQVEEN